MEKKMWRFETPRGKIRSKKFEENFTENDALKKNKPKNMKIRVRMIC